MLKREAIRAVGYLMHRNTIDHARMSFVLNSVNDVSVVERDGRHNDTIYYRNATLYFSDKGHEITKTKFDRLQALTDAAEAHLHLEVSANA